MPNSESSILLLSPGFFNNDRSISSTAAEIRRFIVTTAAAWMILSLMDGWVMLVEGKGYGGGYGGRGGGGGGGGGGLTLWGAKSSIGQVKPSPRMSSFMAGAGVGFVTGRSHRYYYMPYGYYGTYGRTRSWENDNNVCHADVPRNDIKFADPALTNTESVNKSSSNRTVRMYFLCDGRCCGADCCELNPWTIVLIVVGVMFGCCCCGCCCFYTCNDDRDKRPGDLVAAPMTDEQIQQRLDGQFSNNKDVNYPPSAVPAVGIATAKISPYSPPTPLEDVATAYPPTTDSSVSPTAPPPPPSYSMAMTADSASEPPQPIYNPYSGSSSNQAAQLSAP